MLQCWQFLVWCLACTVCVAVLAQLCFRCSCSTAQTRARCSRVRVVVEREVEVEVVLSSFIFPGRKVQHTILQTSSRSSTSRSTSSFLFLSLHLQELVCLLTCSRAPALRLPHFWTRRPVKTLLKTVVKTISLILSLWKILRCFCLGAGARLAIVTVGGFVLLDCLAGFGAFEFWPNFFGRA